MTDFPMRMNLMDIAIRQLKRSASTIDDHFKEPTTSKRYGPKIRLRAQYSYFYEGRQAIKRTPYGDDDDVRGHIVASRDELIRVGLLEFDSVERIDTLIVRKGDMIVQLGTEVVQYLVKAVVHSGQLMTAGSVPVIFYLNFTDISEKTNA